MFEFRYKISFSILHPSIDPVEITSTLGLQPKLQRKAGVEVLNTKGVPMGRKSKLSHWLVDFVDGQFTQSAERPLSDAILDVVNRLHPHDQFLKRLKEENAELEMRVVWLGNSTNSTGVLEASVLQLCGLLGINILIDVYGPEHQLEKLASEKFQPSM